MARDMGLENPYFFWPRNFPGRKIFAAKVKKSQKSWIESFPAGFFFGLKIEKSKKNPDESVYGHNFLEKKSEMLENFGNKQIPSRNRTGQRTHFQGFSYPATPLTPALPQGGGGVCDASALSVRGATLSTGNTASSQPGGCPRGGGGGVPEPPRASAKLKPSGFYSYPISDVKKYEDSMAFRLKYPSKTAGFRPRD